VKAEHIAPSGASIPDDLTSVPAFSIRKAQFDDLRVMAPLIGELFAIETDFMFDRKKQYAGLKLLFEDPHVDILVAKYKNTPIGMVTMQRVVSSAEGGYAGLIEDVIVSENYRGRGVGRSLLQQLIALASKKKYARLQLAADRANSSALDFYKALGFRTTRLNVHHLFDI
jgi:ribosomal protein S18 acetylase RimI-like enzyme